MRCIIMGFFWWDRRVLDNDCEHRIHKFTGCLKINESGKKFSGATKDTYGVATIEGELGKDKMIFVKKYDEEAIRRGAGAGPIEYFLWPFEVNGVVMGWKGSWRKEKEPRTGQAACLFFPDTHGTF